MKSLKLVNGLSYSMMNFSCKKGEPFCVDDETADKLLSTGRFKILGVISETNQSPDSEDSYNPQNDDMDGGDDPERPNKGAELTAELIEKMKKDDLIALATDKSIDIKDCSNNEERIERIKGALGLVNFGNLFEG